MKTDRKKLLNNAYRLSLINLVFRYTELMEFLSAHTAEETGEVFEERVHAADRLIRRHFSGEASVNREEVEALRRENVSDMEELTALTDVFQTDEYILNRLEYGFREDPARDLSNGDLTDLLISYFSRVPRDIQNEAIINVIEQLPIRMTRNRFLDLLKERLGIYRGGELSVFSARLQMLLTAAGAHQEELFSLMDIPADHILSAPRLEIRTREEFDALSDALAASGELLNIRMDLASVIQDVLNSFEAVLISEEEPLKDFELDEDSRSLILRIHDMIELENAAHPDAVYASLGVFEGWPEKLAQEISPLFSEDHADDVIRCLSILMSSSPFTLLDSAGTEEELTEEEFRRLYGEFSEKVLKRLTSVNRTYARALMGRMNAMIPPRFASQEELENYILGSLSGCTDPAERAGVQEILEGIMKEG